MTADLPESLAGAWQPHATHADELTVLFASISAETTVFEPVETTPLEAALASELPVRSLFVVELSFSPPLPSLGVSPASVHSKAVSRATDQLVSLLTDAGVIVDGVRERLEFEAPNGKPGTWSVVDVRYPIADGRSVDATNGTDDADPIRAEAHVAVWPGERTFGVAGGTLPLERPDRFRTNTAAVSDGRSDENRTVEIDPERDRETVSTLISDIDLDADQ
ncbi:hypothetical protein EA462_11040 [Natrarchaeobius halalkaliphilus]|uniref:Uncharacterized protein n=1 Tax=Natrarchaeobius halalkaliphilus TaxID=1679091 RepID=A0A3N6MU57_9EURY|nr:hypothetical protein [Natrarchaeobius halalkaliphilus]RQG88922.1 hypothetical protein EA462_11040 [Natrarchaeobius halalkaliphilus]